MRILLLNLTACVCLLVSCSREAPLTPSKFTEEFAAELRKAAPSLTVKIVRDLELKISGPGGAEYSSFLFNAYDSYTQDPTEKDAVLQRFVAAGIQTFAATRGPVDKMRIVPVVKDRGWLEETRKTMIQRGAKRVPKNVFESINAELVVVYAEDSPKNIRYLTPQDLVEAKLERKDLKDLACENLKRILPKIERHGSGGFYMLTAGGDYEASLLLLDSIWSDDQIEVKGEIVIAIPTRDLLMVTGSNDIRGLQKVRSLVKESIKQGSYRLTSKLFVRRDGRFVVFDE